MVDLFRVLLDTLAGKLLGIPVDGYADGIAARLKAEDEYAYTGYALPWSEWLEGQELEAAA